MSIKDENKTDSTPDKVVRDSDLPVSVAMFNENKEFNRQTFESIDRNFKVVINMIDSLAAENRAQFHELKLIFEEQNNRNRFVLDGYSSLDDRVTNLEKKVFDT